MKNRVLGIFGKVFFYTMLILVLVIAIMFAFFAEQIRDVVESTQKQQINGVFEPLVESLSGKSHEEIVEIAEEFHNKNTSFEFCFMSVDGDVIYKTANFKIPQIDEALPDRNNIIIKGNPLNQRMFNYTLKTNGDKTEFVTLVSERVHLLVNGTISSTGIYNSFVEKALVALLLIIMASVLAAVIFARRIANPIKKIVNDTKRMSDLEYVLAPDIRKDEIGQLAQDVYKMYRTLKATILQLENEIERKKEMEENQRYFFSAASHELKTPIAATCALLEGMLENVIEVSEYPHYLQECLKMMEEQNKLVSEILEIVSLNGDNIEVERHQIHLKKFVCELLKPYRTIADSNNQTISVNISENTVCSVNPKLFAKALSNIIMNAVQNTPPKGEIRVYTDETIGGVRLNIFNSNAMIPSELLPKLFEPFYREDKVRNRDLGRNGLGLTIVKKALDIMEIEFSLESTVDGVLFSMSLPLYPL